MAFIEPMHRNKPNITYLLPSVLCINLETQGISPLATWQLNLKVCDSRLLNPRFSSGYNDGIKVYATEILVRLITVVPAFQTVHRSLFAATITVTLALVWLALFLLIIWLTVRIMSSRACSGLCPMVFATTSVVSGTLGWAAMTAPVALLTTAITSLGRFVALTLYSIYLLDYLVTLCCAAEACWWLTKVS